MKQLNKKKERLGKRDFLLLLISCCTKNISRIIPKKKNRWVFGSWFGKSMSDNPRALYEYLKEYHPEIETAWITRKKMDEDIGGKVLKRNTLSSVWYILRSQVAIFNHGYMDLSSINLIGNTYSVQLWHGVAWKKIGKDARKKQQTVYQKIYYKMLDYVSHYDLYIAPGKHYKNNLKSAFGAENGKILCVGQPRNYVLYNDEKCLNIRKSFLRKIGVNEEDDRLKIVVYMPTFRDYRSREKTFCSGIQAGKMERLAEKYNFIFIEKAHYADAQRSIEAEKYKRIFNGNKENADTLLASADILITDYSSCSFDFMLKNKPIIYYVYDYDYYKGKDRGLYFDIQEIAAGSIVHDEKQLLNAIQINIKNPDLYKEKRINVINEFLTFEGKNSSAKIVDRVLNDLRKL